MSTGEKKTCYSFFKINGRNDRTVEAMEVDMGYLTGDGTIEVEAYEINMDNTKELTIVGSCPDLDVGLGSMKTVFENGWKAHMNSGIYCIMEQLKC